MATVFKLAAGENNPGGLQRLDEIASPLFDLYRLDVRTEWHEWEARQRAGDLSVTITGRPYVVVLLDAISATERQLFRTTYCAGQYAPVTVQVYNKFYGGTLIYNGQFEWPDFPDEQSYFGGWRDIRLVISNLRRYTAFSSAFDPLAYGV